MDKDTMNSLKAAIRENKAYDWIANNYYKLSKEDLKDVALEIIYMYYDITMTEPTSEGQEQCIESLEERFDMRVEDDDENW